MSDNPPSPASSSPSEGADLHPYVRFLLVRAETIRWLIDDENADPDDIAAALSLDGKQVTEIYAKAPKA